MKTFKLLALFITAAFSVTSVKAQTADEIISKHVEAIGGLDKWKSITSMIQTGTMTAQGAQLEVVATVLHGKGSRQDITVMGMNNYMILTQTEGWRYFPVQGQQAPEAITADDVKEGQDGLDIAGALVDYKAKGHSAEYLGKEDVDGTECHKIKITLKSGKSQTYFIDPSNFYILKSISVTKSNGQEAELTSSYSNYQKLPEGIVVPMNIGIPFAPGMTFEFVVTKVELNKPIDESIFKVTK